MNLRVLFTRMTRKILVKKNELNLKMMLEGGQSFRWKRTGDSEWTGVMLDLVWVVKQFDEYMQYEVFGGDNLTLFSQVNGVVNDGRKRVIENQDEVKHLDQVLMDYFRLHHDINKYYEEWSENDLHFKNISKEYPGIRILNQDPIENIFSFICSSNNNIKRITSMITKLCELFGEKIVDLNGCSYYSFPSLSALTQPSVEQELKKAGFGYRAKYLHQSAILLNSLGGTNFLNRLKLKSYESARNHLMKFPGIGRKVADCICLMSLGHLEAVPVDTHVFKLASEIYLPHICKVKSVTTKIYEEISDHFRNLYGPLAGWAHAVLFCADLKTFGTKSDKTENYKISKSLNATHRSLSSGRITSEENIEIERGTIMCSREELHLRITLNSGQTYRWQELKRDVWRGVYNNRVWTLHQSDNKIDFICMRSIKDDPPNKKGVLQANIAKQLLYDYFRLDFPLQEHYQRWSSADQHFQHISKQFYGLRMIRQDIVENLFAFICSSNNTINRMRNMVEILCKLYGEEIITLDGTAYYNFPSVTKLAEDCVEKELRSSNFGFRAAYIKDSARYIVEHGNQLWFHNICQLSYEDAKKELMKLPGIGRKVADCICLTALDHLNTIPVDTHVYQIATKYYLSHSQTKNAKQKNKTISVAVYQEIGDRFRNLFGDFAGWAHTVLFCADLRQHMDLKSPKKVQMI